MGRMGEIVALKASVGSVFLWRTAAEAAGLTLSAWVRQVCDAAVEPQGYAPTVTTSKEN